MSKDYIDQLTYTVDDEIPIGETDPAHQPSNNYTHNTSHRKKTAGRTG